MTMLSSIVFCISAFVLINTASCNCIQPQPWFLTECLAAIVRRTKPLHWDLTTALVTSIFYSFVHRSASLAQLLLQQHTSASASIIVPILAAIAWPEKYFGDPVYCNNIFLQWQFYFNFHPNLIERAKITQFMHMLTGRALTWTTAIWQGGENFMKLEHYEMWCNEWGSINLTCMPRWCCFTGHSHRSLFDWI